MLILIGLYALYVAVSHDHPTQATNLVVQQGTWVIVGLFVALIVMHMDSRFLWNLTPFFLPIRSYINGSTDLFLR